MIDKSFIIMVLACAAAPLVGAGALAASTPSLMTQPGYSGSETGAASGSTIEAKLKM